MSLLDEKIKEQLKTVFEKLINEVNLISIGNGDAKSIEAEGFAKDFSDLSSKINYEVIDKKDAEKYGVDKFPAIIILDKDKKDLGVKFYGVPGGHEINSFVIGILNVSGSKRELAPQILERLGNVKEKIKLQVFISLACPHCPDAVVAAHRLAIENTNITAEMIDCGSFSDLAKENAVSSVPKTVINGGKFFVGAQPIEKILDTILV